MNLAFVDIHCMKLRPEKSSKMELVKKFVS